MHAAETKLQLLGRLTRRVAEHPRKTMLIVLLAVCACALLAVGGLRFKSDRSDLISPDADFHRRWLEYCERFRETNELLILVESPSLEEMTEARQWIVGELEAREELFTHTMLHSTLEEWEQPDTTSTAEQLQALESRYRLAAAIQQRPEGGTPLHVLLASMNQEISRNEALPPNTSPGTNRNSLELTTRVTDSLEKSLRAIDYSYQGVFPDQDERQELFWNSDRSGQAFTRSTAAEQEISPESLVDGPFRELISVVPIETGITGGEKYAPNLEELDRLLAAARQRFSAAYIGVTGIPQLEHEEMQRSQGDMLLSSLASLTGVILLLIFGFRGFLLPLACCITLACSMIWTLGFTTLAIGHLNILSMAFAAILVGLGIDFGIHLLSSYQHYRQDGWDNATALGMASDTVGKGIVTAAVTTSVAFLCAGLTDFPGVAELGIIAGGGVLLAGVATFCVFPAAVTLMGRSVDREAFARAEDSPRAVLSQLLSAEPVRKLIAGRPLLILLGLSVPLAIVSWQAWDWDESGVTCRVHYDANLLNMQPEHLPAVEAQNRLLENRDGDVLYAVTWYNSREQALVQADRFRDLPTVGRVVEMASTETSAGESDLASVQSLLQTTSNLAAPPDHALPHNPAQVGQLLEQLLSQLRRAAGVSETQLGLRLDHFLDIYSRQPFEIQIHILEAVEQDLVRALWSQIRLHTAQLTEQFHEQQRLGEILTSRYLNDSGDWLLQIYPRQNIWNDASLAEFVQDIRQVDPDVTGTPIQNFEASRQLKNSYLNAALYAALAIVLVVVLDVTSLRTILKIWTASALVIAALYGIKIASQGPGLADVTVTQLFIAFVACVVLGSLLAERRPCLIGLLALFPPTIGALLMLGLMYEWGLQFTPANLIALPLVMGIGIDDGVHVIHDFRRSGRRYYMSANTWRALVLTTLTSVIGFGSLALASHRGLAGLGSVVVIGITSCLFASVVVLPALLSLVSRTSNEEADKDAEPVIYAFPRTAELEHKPEREVA